MKSIILTLSILTLSAAIAVAGGGYSSKSVQQVTSPDCPQWYADNEWNVSLWGTYVFTNTDFAPNPDLIDVIQSTSEGGSVLGTFDKYIGDDHAWGGGGDIKYFFHRYFGVGIEGFALDARKSGFDIFADPTVPVIDATRTVDQRAVGAVLGTFTIRYPIRCTRFAPYGWAGFGGIFGGGESDTLRTQGPPNAFAVFAQTHHYSGESKLLGHFGFGLETRITRNIGWINDLSWGVIDGPDNNFTMFRTGINFAF